MSESKRRRQRGIVSDKIDRTTTAYYIIVKWLGGPTKAAEIAERKIPTVYGWLQRGRVPADQQENLSDKAAEAGKGFPAEWYLKRPADVDEQAAAEAA